MRKEIVISGDILRVDHGGRPNQLGNVGWLRRLIAPALKLAVRDFPVGKVHWDRGVSDFDGQMVYAAHGLVPSASSWAQLFHQAPNDLALAYLGEFFSDRIVVGFELSPYLRTALEALNAVYIDLCIHPVRYMEDLMMFVSTNDSDVASLIEQFSLTADDLLLRSSFAAGAWRQQGYIAPRHHSALLLCLQTRRDRVLIDNGEFVTMDRFIGTLKELRKGVDRFLVKAHPFELSSPQLSVVLDNVKNVDVVDRNFYEILVRHEVDSVYSMSSGTSIEASYLGVPGHHLFRDYYTHPENLAGGGAFQAVMDDFLWPDFWRQTLAPLLPTSALGGYRRATTSGVVRRSIGESWGFGKWA